MAHPGIFAIILGFAIGTAIYYYLNSESPQSHQFNQDRSQSRNYHTTSPEQIQPNYTTRQRRRRIRKNCEESNEPCVICFENLTLGLHELIDCGHVFHYKCIMNWLEEKKNCPICRVDVK